MMNICTFYNQRKKSEISDNLGRHKTSSQTSPKEAGTSPTQILDRRCWHPADKYKTRTDSATKREKT